METLAIVTDHNYHPKNSSGTTTNGFCVINYVWGIHLTTVATESGNFQFSNPEMISCFSPVVIPKAFNQFHKLQIYVDGA